MYATVLTLNEVEFLQALTQPPGTGRYLGMMFTGREVNDMRDLGLIESGPQGFELTDAGRKFTAK